MIFLGIPAAATGPNLECRNFETLIPDGSWAHFAMGLRLPEIGGAFSRGGWRICYVGDTEVNTCQEKIENQNEIHEVYRTK